MEESAEVVPEASNLFKNAYSKRDNVLTYYQLGMSAWNVLGQIRHWYKNRNVYTLDISTATYQQFNNASRVYNDFQFDSKSRKVFTINNDGDMLFKDEWETASWKGLTFELIYEAGNFDGQVKSAGGFSYKFKSAEDLKTFVKHVSSYTKKNSQPYILGRNELEYSDGDRKYITRTWDSVVIDPEIKAMLHEDIDSLFRNAERYRDLGLPVRRGYVFYGSPGDGKSSMIQGMAHEYNMNLAPVDINKFKNNQEFIDYIAVIPKNTIILFEDIDAFAATDRRTEEGVNLSGLLNVLDGVTTPENVIFIITTNHIDELDEAILRPGRCDRQIHFTHPNHDRIEEAFKTFFSEDLEVEVPVGYSMATYTEIMRRHVDDVAAARAELKEMKPVSA